MPSPCFRPRGGGGGGWQKKNLALYNFETFSLNIEMYFFNKNKKIYQHISYLF
jgi:hypothetical protein